MLLKQFLQFDDLQIFQLDFIVERVYDLLLLGHGCLDFVLDHLEVILVGVLQLLNVESVLVVPLLQLAPKRADLAFFCVDLGAKLLFELLAQVFLLALDLGELLVLSEVLALQLLDLLLLGLEVQLKIIDPSAQNSQILVQHYSIVAFLLVLVFPLLEGDLLLLNFSAPFLLDVLHLPLVLLHQLLLRRHYMITSMTDT